MGTLDEFWGYMMSSSRKFATEGPTHTVERQLLLGGPVWPQPKELHIHGQKDLSLRIMAEDELFPLYYWGDTPSTKFYDQLAHTIYLPYDKTLYRIYPDGSVVEVLTAIHGSLCYFYGSIDKNGHLKIGTRPAWMNPFIEAGAGSVSCHNFELPRDVVSIHSGWLYNGTYIRVTKDSIVYAFDGQNWIKCTKRGSIYHLGEKVAEEYTLVMELIFDGKYKDD